MSGLDKLKASKRANLAVVGVIVSVASLLITAIAKQYFPELDIEIYLPQILNIIGGFGTVLLLGYSFQDGIQTWKESGNNDATIQESASDVIEVIADLVEDDSIDE
jgi:hypothetical protein